MPAVTASQACLPDMRPEEALILACTRVRLTPGDDGRLRELASPPLDWPYLLGTAARHGLTPLIYRHLKAAAADLVPPAFLAELEQANLRNAAWNLLLTAELVRLLSLFEATGIAALPFKGPALAAQVYGDLSLRQFRDLDLLIHPEDFSLAKEIILKQGYRPLLNLSGDQEKALLRTMHHLEFLEENHGMLVELHWAISKWWAPLAVGDPGWWERAQFITLSGKRALGFSPEDTLLIHCVHGATHCWDRLGWILDVAALLDTFQNLKWAEVINLARETRSERLLFLGLKLARYLSPAPLHAEVDKMMHSDSAVEGLARHAWERLFSGPRRRFEFVREALFHVRLRRSWQDKILFGCRSLFSPTDEDMALLSLPPAGFFLYRLLRPFRLAGKHLLKLKALQK